VARVTPRCARATPLLALWALMAAVPAAHADAGWLEAGDLGLRTDLALLNDAGVMRVPVSQWPMPRAALEYALGDAKAHFATNAAVKAALDRVRARMAAPARVRFGVAVAGGEPGLLRDFDTPARESGELGGRVDYLSERFAVSLSVTGVADPDDDQALRADGSHATVKLGNWLVSANTLDRYWGPSYESSLILSNNARPMPTFTVERAAARPFATPWLSWLGPWRFSLGVSQMESDREDTESPLFLAWRIVVMPFNSLEIGFTRTAQFCGEGLECNLDVFGNLLAGNDNVGIDATPDNEPGNQMAGFDARWNSPLGNLPYALYSQMIGEDESSYLPAKYLAQYGVEGWKPFTDGSVLHGFLEYTSTTCSANTDRGPYYNCAYTQGRFNVEGYRYRGRVIGHTADADAEAYALGAVYSTARGDLWTATARTIELNHDGFDPNNTVSANPAKYRSLELGWRGDRFGGKLALELGAQAIQPRGGERDIEPYGFVSWRRDFRP
jgi:hypothetical protein